MAQECVHPKQPNPQAPPQEPPTQPQPPDSPRGEAVPGNDGGGLTGGTAPATPEPAATPRANADGSTAPAPGTLGTPPRYTRQA